MVRLRRGSTDHGRTTSLLGRPAAAGGGIAGSGSPRSRSSAGVGRQGAGAGDNVNVSALGINAEQLEYLRRLASSVQDSANNSSEVKSFFFRTRM